LWAQPYSTEAAHPQGIPWGILMDWLMQAVSQVCVRDWLTQAVTFNICLCGVCCLWWTARSSPSLYLMRIHESYFIQGLFFSSLLSALQFVFSRGIDISGLSMDHATHVAYFKMDWTDTCRPSAIGEVVRR
jgi:hypothetical protein